MNIGHNGGPKFEERWYQEEAVEALFTYYAQPRPYINGLPVPRNPLICLPTGTGKSHVIAKFLKRAFEFDPSTRAVMATHVHELISQNASKLLDSWSGAPVGIYSAGLGRSDTLAPIIFGGIQSMAGKFPIFGFRDFLIIDEAHLLADEGRYQKFILELLAKNPLLKVIGLTATPYRQGLGLMTNGNIFTDIIYNLCTIDGFSRLIAEGYLCTLITKKTATELDVSGVGVRNGDFIPGELDKAVNKADVNTSLISEYLYYAQNRKCGTIFAASIDHCEHLASIMESFGVECAVLHSKKSTAHNREMMGAWKAGEIKHAINMNMLTTGVDNPMLDIIGDGQPTLSTGKHVQKNGRATRPYSGKQNGLILDYAGNIRRLGPINDPLIPRLRGEGSPGDAPVRICPNCGVYNHASVRECVACGLKFDFSPTLNRSASSAEVLVGGMPEVSDIKVDRIVYLAHKSIAGKDGIKICYYCGFNTYYDYKNINAAGFHGKTSRDWFRQVYGEPSQDMNNNDVLALMSYLKPPKLIRVWTNAKPNPRVLSQEF